jgi:hypothetical protein
MSYVGKPWNHLTKSEKSYKRRNDSFGLTEEVLTPIVEMQNAKVPLVADKLELLFKLSTTFNQMNAHNAKMLYEHGRYGYVPPGSRWDLRAGNECVVRCNQELREQKQAILDWMTETYETFKEHQLYAKRHSTAVATTAVGTTNSTPVSTT